MPLTRVEGDFSQISNVVQVTTPVAPEPGGSFLSVAWTNATYFLFGSDLSLGPVLVSNIDTRLGYVIGMTRGGPLTEGANPVIGANMAINEAVSTGGSRSEDMGQTWATEGGPLWSSAPVRCSSVAWGNLPSDPADLGVFLEVGTTNAGATAAAYSVDYGNDGFTWSNLNAALSSEGGNGGASGVGYHVDANGDGYFFVYMKDGTIVRNQYLGDASFGGFEFVQDSLPSYPAFNPSTALPFAKFASTGQTLVFMFCGHLIHSVDNGATWRTTYEGALLDGETGLFILGGAGFNSPDHFGIAAGEAIGHGQVFVAVLNVPGPFEGGTVPRIMYTELQEADFLSWTEITLPAGATELFDVVYDTVGARFIVLGYDFDDVYGSTYYLYESQDMENWTIAWQASFDDGGTRNVGFMTMAYPTNYTPPTPPTNWLSLSNYETTAFGGSGSGDQEPHVRIIFGAGNLVPLGRVYVGGGALNGAYNPALEVLGYTVTDPDPLGLERASVVVAQDWWSPAATEPPNPADWEVRLDVVGDQPNGSPTGTWISLADEPDWSYGAVFGTPASGVWTFQLRIALTQQVMMIVSSNITQDVGT